MKNHIGRRRGGRAIALLLVVVFVFSLAAASPASATVSAPATATSAPAHVGAFLLTEHGMVGFATEAKMDKFIAANYSTTCATSLRLYSGPNYTGTVLSTAIRWTYLNLRNYGFSNVTSSYRVGACSVELYGGDNGSGGVYPGGTWAGASSPAMWSGWENAVSSLYMF